MTTSSSVLCFAYGSNMYSPWLRARVPSVVALGRALLRGYELRWHKVSKDGSGKCDVVVAPHGTVHGVLYEVPSIQKRLLDAAEGLGAGYNEKQVDVEGPAGVMSSWLYYATKVDASRRPYTWYKALVVAGAKEHSLPLDYLDRLEDTPAQRDPDAAREAKALALLKSSSVGPSSHGA